jgi:hypothetical protein
MRSASPAKPRSPAPSIRRLDGSEAEAEGKLKAISSEFEVAVKTSGATCARTNGTVGLLPLLQAVLAQN